MRRPYRAPPPVKEGPRINTEIRVPEVQLVDHEGENRGIITVEEALGIADEAGLDLVEVSPTQKPPVCKILDYGRFKYQSQKKAAEARKKQKTIDVKEVKMRPNIDTHDYEVKMRNARRFLEDEDKVKMTMRFRGREMAHQYLGLELLHKVRDELADAAKVEYQPKMEGRQMIMILAPLPAKPGAKKAKPAAKEKVVSSSTDAPAEAPVEPSPEPAPEPAPEAAPETSPETSDEAQAQV